MAVISRVRRHPVVLIPVVVLLLVIVGVVAGRSGGMRHQLSLSFTRQDPPLTELYFNRPDLIAAAGQGSFPQPLTFAVRNDSEQAVTKDYSVSLRSGSNVLQKYTGIVQVAGRKTTTSTISLVAPQGAKDYTVSVVLTESNQTIFFHGTVH
ncbi:hypothetical protein FAIPA1_40153 [Frankia sp. AiPs1]